MHPPELTSTKGSKVTNLAIVIALHIGAVVAFVGCVTPPEPMLKMVDPVEVKLVHEFKQPAPFYLPLPVLEQTATYPHHGIQASPASIELGAPGEMASTERYPTSELNGTTLVANNPVSTFSVDVDTASYAMVRRALNSGMMPTSGAVRVEEMVNYFPYQYAGPDDRSHPFQVSTEVMPSPWKEGKQLIHIAVRGYQMTAAQRPRANVVLLIDVSGSMMPDDRLPLLKRGFRHFVEQLQDDDRVSIVTYANGTATVLDPTAGKHKTKIMAALDDLGAGGGTAGAEGLQRAYALAERHFDKAGVNRVVLATDGDFNIGISDTGELEKFIVQKRKSGVYLSILGVGMGNLNDALIQRLAQAGNGNAAYIDTIFEARKALSTELGANMFPIANDVKVQVAFNPKLVATYRLVGYETRMLAQEDFSNDAVDAGDMGAGHTVTAIYEITPAEASNAKANAALCSVKLRYKLPGEKESRLSEYDVAAASAHQSMDAVPAEQRFAVAVAAFGQRLRKEKGVADLGYEQIAQLAAGSRGADPQGYRAEFVALVRKAERLSQ